MKAFMTNGTIDFLEKLVEKHPEINFFLMNSTAGALAYYENKDKQVFASGREYEALTQSGQITQEGFVVMNNIPVTDDDTAVFEDRFKQQEKAVDGVEGFQAFRLLKPKKGNKYVVFTQWRSEKDFENWKNSAQFAKAHQKQATKPSAYPPNKPFVTTYHMYDPEAE
ncbi:heme-degrading monooxygenase HmoA [Virgibacillus halotolerans]|uniref:antibiotic biosynthesis monooxygenase family protein n=1 Tax=Virgibacillus halotolerans TaxID=1071053 RepID=UPI0019609D20|nr:antibiotic biosynthesis monooxygenase [Virgibacillus halotolerans]MBM7601675.1 heme-degrading monooxygenase HmoA [Virgibacillus halotolerans]